MNSQTGTNASSALTARVMADARVGTFTSLVTKLKGAERGKGPDRKTYGDDEVLVTIFTGFNYSRLCERSLKALDTVTDAEIVADDLAREQKCIRERLTADGATQADIDGAVAAVTARFTEADVAMARAELVESLTLSRDGENESTTDAVYEPLIVDGETVKGCRVYRCKQKIGAPGECHCRECSGWTPDSKGKKPPMDGTIYVQGLQVWKKVLTPAPNGAVPAANSSSKTLAKKVLRDHCPIRRYTSYALEPKPQDPKELERWYGWSLHAGGTATLEATEKGFVVTEEILSIVEKAW